MNYVYFTTDPAPMCIYLYNCIYMCASVCASLNLGHVTMATDPLRQAVWRQVVPLVSQASRFAPSLTSHRTPARFRLAENSSSSRSTSFSSSKVSPKTAPAESQADASSRSSLSTPCWTFAFGQTPLSLQKSFALSFPILRRIAGHFRFGHGLSSHLHSIT